MTYDPVKSNPPAGLVTIGGLCETSFSIAAGTLLSTGYSVNYNLTIHCLSLDHYPNVILTLLQQTHFQSITIFFRIINPLALSMRGRLHE